MRRARTRRPPKDNVNCLLSFVYTLMLHDVRSALETVGLDPQVGFLHRDLHGRPVIAMVAVTLDDNRVNALAQEDVLKSHLDCGRASTG